MQDGSAKVSLDNNSLGALNGIGEEISILEGAIDGVEDGIGALNGAIDDIAEGGYSPPSATTSYTAPEHDFGMDITVILFDPVLQEVYLGSLDVDDEDNEIWVDQYGKKLDGIAMWAELPYPQNQMALPKGEN